MLRPCGLCSWLSDLASSANIEELADRQSRYLALVEVAPISGKTGVAPHLKFTTLAQTWKALRETFLGSKDYG